MQPGRKGGSEGKSGGGFECQMRHCTPWLRAQPSAIEGPGRACRLRPLICRPAGSVGPHTRIIARTVHVAVVVLHPIQASLAQNNGVCGSAQTGAPAYCIKMCALSRSRNVGIKQMVPPSPSTSVPEFVKCTSGSGILCGESTITTLPRKTLASIRAVLGFRSPEVIRVSSRLRHNSMSCSWHICGTKG